MVEILRYGKDDLSRVTNRSQLNLPNIADSVRKIVYDVRERGDKALFEYEEKFDQTVLSDIKVSKEEIEQAYKEVDAELLATLRRAKDNILSYHKKQLRSDIIVGEEGKRTGVRFRAVERAGLYSPGGLAAYPSSVLMCALPAVAAGVPEIYLATPFKNGKCNPLVLVAANECGITTIYKMGGAQAIAAFAFGTESVQKTDVIAGPGNIYVTLAKKEVFGYVNIDMIAGPSEILVVADDSANAKFVAADMLSQSEHDEMAAGILITTSERLAKEAQREVDKQVSVLPKKDICEKSLAANGAIILCDNMDECIALANAVAPEHMELICVDSEKYVPKIKNCGALFIGEYSPEPLGDYFAGPNHVLPTSGTSRYFSVLSVDNFLKKISYIEYDKKNLLLAADDIMKLAKTEGLMAHANSIKVRSENENG